ncbi:hypothetical protein QIH80_33845 [Bradyrhizobium elkanii]|nr:hypothetical protein QIH80_33845 [Bradyrhizobium elkanii]
MALLIATDSHVVLTEDLPRSCRIIRMPASPAKVPVPKPAAPRLKASGPVLRARGNCVHAPASGGRTASSWAAAGDKTGFLKEDMMIVHLYPRPDAKTNRAIAFFGSTNRKLR